MLALTLNPLETELTTAATDVMLALAAMGGAWMLARTRRALPAEHAFKMGIWIAVLMLLAVVATCGAAFHALAGGKELPVKFWFWQPVMLGAGLAVGLFVAGTFADAFGARAAKITAGTVVALALALAFYGVTLAMDGAFVVLVMYELAAMLISLVTYAVLAAKRRPGAGLMTAGIALTIFAAVVQTTGALAFTLVWQFDHNSAFHLIQMAAIAVLVAGIRATVAPTVTGAPNANPKEISDART